MSRKGRPFVATVGQHAFEAKFLEETYAFSCVLHGHTTVFPVKPFGIQKCSKNDLRRLKKRPETVQNGPETVPNRHLGPPGAVLES